MADSVKKSPDEAKSFLVRSWSQVEGGGHVKSFTAAMHERSNSYGASVKGIKRSPQRISKASSLSENDPSSKSQFLKIRTLQLRGGDGDSTGGVGTAAVDGQGGSAAGGVGN